MKVLIADKFEKAGIDGLKALGCAVLNEPGAGADGLGAALAAHTPDALVVRSSKVPAAAIAGARGLKLIVRAGSGVDNVDVPAATAAGIAVCNCPGMNAVAVAELTLGLLLCCDRRIPDQTIDARAGRWNKKEYAKARGLKGLTLGVVGVGAIGRAVIKRAVAFEMRVLAWSRGITREHAHDLGAEWGGTDTPALHALAAKCDAISVHLPATDSTKKLIGREFLAAMKPGAYLVNTSRGSLVDEAELREAIAAKGIRAALDVYESQPAATEGAWDCPTAKLPWTVCTHHAGASTDQAQAAVADEVVRIVRVFRDTGRAENCVNEADLGGAKGTPGGVSVVRGVPAGARAT